MQSSRKPHRFAGDFRSQLIGKEKEFVNFNPHNFIRSKDDRRIVAQYLGQFWNEKASDGSLTNDSCKQVVDTENKLIEKCDVFIVYFDEILSPSGITELAYAAVLKKKIIIFFKPEDTRYSVKSSAWYPIVFSKLIGDDVIIEPVTGTEMVGERIVALLSKTI